MRLTHKEIRNRNDFLESNTEEIIKERDELKDFLDRLRSLMDLDDDFGNETSEPIFNR